MMRVYRFDALTPSQAARVAQAAYATASQVKRDTPKWWRLTLTLHQGVTVIRNVITKPDAHEVLESGWFEVAANGDEFAVGYDSIATVCINGFSGPMPGSTS